MNHGGGLGHGEGRQIWQWKEVADKCGRILWLIAYRNERRKVETTLWFWRGQLKKLTFQSPKQEIGEERLVEAARA